MQYVLDSQQCIVYSFDLKKTVDEKRKGIVKEISGFTTEHVMDDISIYFLAVSIMDRFIAKKALLPNEFKNVAKASFMIAYRAVHEDDFVNDDKLIDILAIDILNCLNFNIFLPTVYTFLQFYESSITIDQKFALLELMKVSVKIGELVTYFPSEVFQACYYLATSKDENKITKGVLECINHITSFLNTKNLSLENVPEVKLSNPKIKKVNSSTKIPMDAICISKGEYGKVLRNDDTVHKCYRQGKIYVNAIIRELGMLRYFTNLTHKNVINMLSYRYDVGTAACEMEKFPYTLSCYLKNFKYNESNNLKIMKQILEGMAFIHENGFIHRDIKPQNIVINDELEVKIIDMGLNRKIDGIPCYGSTNVITAPYRPLELFEGVDRLYYSTEIDIWSIGCVFFEILTGTPLMKQTDDDKLEKEFFKKFGVLKNKCKTAPKTTYENMETLIKNACSENLNESYAYFLLSFLQVNPKYRIKSCADALNHPIFSL